MLTISIYIVLNTLHYLMLCIDNVYIDSTEYITHFHVLYWQSTVNALEILMSCIDNIDIYSIWWYGWKALSCSFPKLFFGLKIGSILRKLWAEMCGCVLYWQCWHTQHTQHTMHCTFWSFVLTISTWEWRSHCTLLCTHTHT